MKPLLTCLLAAALCTACGDSKPPAAPASTTSATAPGAEARKAPPSANVYERVAAEGKGFTVGSMMAAKPVYVFFDSQCPHCSTLWHASQPLLGQIRMVWMPVRLLNDISLHQGAAILSAKDPAEEMERHEKIRDQDNKGMVPPKDLPKDALDAVRSNTQLFASIGSSAVPTVVYLNPANGQPASVESAFDTAGLRKLLGL